MAGSSNLFDRVQLTSSSEYSSREGYKIQYLQVHHATLTSLAVLIDMMQPGGRTVSANGAMGNDGELVEVVPLNMRAFTSASAFDRQSLTVECCNTTLGPDWGISIATMNRLAQLAADMFRAGLLGGLNRQFIIGHNEVPGSYATACPGPSMNLDYVVSKANEIYNGGGGSVSSDEEETMKLIEQRFTNGAMANVMSMPFADVIVQANDWAAAKKNYPNVPVVQMNEYDYESYSRIKSIGERAQLAAIDKTLDDEQAELLAAIKAIQVIQGTPGDDIPDPVSFASKLLNILGPSLSEAVANELRARLES